jgi:hypothetical protein
MGFLLLAYITTGLGQPTINATSRSAPAAPGIYESFFRSVVTLNNLRESKSDHLVQPGLQEVTGLTDQQMSVLNEVAEACLAKMPRYSVAGHDVYFESLLRSIDSGQDDTQWLAQRLNEVDYQRTTTVSDHVQQLRVRLGEVSFQALDVWVHSSFPHHCFVKPCGVKRR